MQRGSLKQVGLLGVAALVLGFVLTSPALAAYPPGSSTTCDEPSDTSVTVGETITVTGNASSGTSCFDGGTTVELHFRQSDTKIGSTTTDSSGNFSVSGAVPSTAHAGAASIEVRGSLGGSTQSYTTAVTVGGAASGTTTLPKTGRDIAFMVLWGLGLVVAGTFFVRLAWRRKRRTA